MSGVAAKGAEGPGRFSSSAACSSACRACAVLRSAAPDTCAQQDQQDLILHSSARESLMSDMQTFSGAGQIHSTGAWRAVCDPTQLPASAASQSHSNMPMAAITTYLK